MKAIRIHEYGGAGTLMLEEVPRLSIADDQILIRIRDAGVNPIDWKIRQGYMKQVRPAAFPIASCGDFTLRVAQLTYLSRDVFPVRIPAVLLLINYSAFNSRTLAVCRFPTSTLPLNW